MGTLTLNPSASVVVQELNLGLGLYILLPIPSELKESRAVVTTLAIAKSSSIHFSF